MSSLRSLRDLVAPPSGARTGTVVGPVGPGYAYVSSSDGVVHCATTLGLSVGDRVRIIDRTVVARVDQIKKDIPVFRV